MISIQSMFFFPGVTVYPRNQIGTKWYSLGWYEGLDCAHCWSQQGGNPSHQQGDCDCSRVSAGAISSHKNWITFWIKDVGVVPVRHHKQWSFCGWNMKNCSWVWEASDFDQPTWNRWPICGWNTEVSRHHESSWIPPPQILAAGMDKTVSDCCSRHVSG